MINGIQSFLCALALGWTAAPAATPLGADKLKVVATIPDLADIVQEIGGDRVDVTTLTRGRENLHFVVARPSHLVAMSRADMFVQVGLSLEAAFVPGLLERARNDDIWPGHPGFVNVSEGWEPIEVPTSLSRRAGDLHPHGNPHMNLDPRAGEFMANAIRDGLTRLDPGSAELYEKRHQAYLQKLAQAKQRWDRLAASFRGKRVAVYHLEYNYFARYYEMEIADAIEFRPGVPPTPNHLARVIAGMKEKGVKVILIAPWSRNGDVERVAAATGARIVEVPNQAGGMPGADTWIGMMTVIHEKLAAAFGAGGSDG
ncbi:MAG TPA: metal ABC transporter substrate-binding protein [Planctomycetota bacterium]|nr:metal ABC transporter substrate-binding protein [Planctomycetota bacterium]